LLCIEHTFTLTIESLLKIDISLRKEYTHLLFSKIRRLLDYIIALTTQAIDAEALNLFVWCFDVKNFIFIFNDIYIYPGFNLGLITHEINIFFNLFFILVNYLIIELSNFVTNVDLNYTNFGFILFFNMTNLKFKNVVHNKINNHFNGFFQ